MLGARPSRNLFFSSLLGGAKKSPLVYSLVFHLYHPGSPVTDSPYPRRSSCAGARSTTGKDTFDDGIMRLEYERAAEKFSFEGVILSAAGVPGNGAFAVAGVEAKDLLFARVRSKADPSLAENRRDLRMTLLRVFQQPVGADAGE